jgi:hypothetical protein
VWRLLSPPQPALPLLVAATAAAAGYASAAKFAVRGLLAARGQALHGRAGGRSARVQVRVARRSERVMEADGQRDLMRVCGTNVLLLTALPTPAGCRHNHSLREENVCLF